jgi:hypothetical protein
MLIYKNEMIILGMKEAEIFSRVFLEWDFLDYLLENMSFNMEILRNFPSHFVSEIVRKSTIKMYNS